MKVHLNEAAGTVNKQAKSDVNYRPAETPDHRSCGLCEYFDKGSCQLVAGKINSEDICDLFHKDT